MTGDVLQDIFDPIIEDILRLADSQVKDALLKRCGIGKGVKGRLKGIFLVGGFGSSRYLKDRLQKEYECMGIQVIQPHDAWGAIVKVAVLSRVANQATVVSTQAVRHYGVFWNPEFDPIVDRGRPTFYRSDDGKTRVRKVTWYIHKGEDLKRDQVIKFPFYRTIDENYRPSDLIFCDDLVYSESKVAPTYPGSAVKTSCQMRWCLTDVNKKLFKKRTGFDGKNYIDIDYHLVLSTTTANMKFSLEIEGKEMGSVEASYV